MSRVCGGVAALVLALLVWAPAAGAADCLSPHSWVAGSTWLCGGTFVYGDYVDDDFGADTGEVNHTSRTASLAPSAGDKEYPVGEEATADLIRLTLRVNGDRLEVTGLYNALYKPDSTELAVAIDTDHDARTGGGPWPGLGVRSAGWERFAAFTKGDPATNTISGSMPLPSGSRWRVQAVSVNRATGNVMNVAFRGVHEHASSNFHTAGQSGAGSWFEDDQAAALRSGDISQFGADVSVADLRGKVTRAAADAGPGMHERVYESRYTIPPGEGISIAGVPGRGNGGGAGVKAGYEQSFQYLGRFQPYGVYVPRQSGPHGMQMLFHGSSSVLSALINQPGMQARFGEGLDRILVVPEARGQNGFGSDISERDLLDVMADVQASYPIDPERVVAGGYSQGGYITYRMAELWPDRFAGAVDWVGFTGDDENGTPAQGRGYSAGAVGNAIDFVGNMRHVPAQLLYAGADELVHTNTATAMDNAFKATDDVFTYYLHPGAEHLTFAALDDWGKEAAASKGWRLVHDPPRVTFRTAPFLDDPAHEIVHDHAYWISKLRPRSNDPNVYEDVDLTSRACGGTTPAFQVGMGSGPDPLPWSSDFRRVSGVLPLERGNVLAGTLRNVASLRIDTGGTCLAGSALSYSIQTDGPVTLALGDGRTIHLAGAGAHTGTLAAPLIRAGARSCVRGRALTLRLSRPNGARVVSVRVSANGRRAKAHRRGTRLTLSSLPRGTIVRVRIVLRAKRGGRTVTVRQTRTFRVCAR